VELALLPYWLRALFAATYVLGASFTTSSSSWPRFCFPLSDSLAAHHLLVITVTYDAKPDNSWRPCGNSSRFNVQIVKDSYPIQMCKILWPGCMENLSFLKRFGQGVPPGPHGPSFCCKTANITYLDSLIICTCFSDYVMPPSLSNV
jgi:hypothetical protein